MRSCNRLSVSWVEGLHSSHLCNLTAYSCCGNSAKVGWIPGWQKERAHDAFPWWEMTFSFMHQGWVLPERALWRNNANEIKWTCTPRGPNPWVSFPILLLGDKFLFFPISWGKIQYYLLIQWPQQELKHDHFSSIRSTLVRYKRLVSDLGSYFCAFDGFQFPWGNRTNIHTIWSCLNV